MESVTSRAGAAVGAPPFAKAAGSGLWRTPTRPASSAVR